MLADICSTFETDIPDTILAETLYNMSNCDRIKNECVLET